MKFIRYLYYKITLTGHYVGYKNHQYKVRKVKTGWYSTNDIYVTLDKESHPRHEIYVMLSSCYRMKRINKWEQVRKYYKG